MTVTGWIISAVVILAGSMALGLLIVNAWAAVRKAKRKPKTRELVTRIGVDMRPMVESMRKAGEAMQKLQSGMRHAHCRSVMVPEPAEPPVILCSACGDTLERNGDRFQCTGCGRQVG